MQSGLAHMISFRGEAYRALSYGTVYYVPGTASAGLDRIVREYAEDLAAAVNADEANWVTCQIICLDADNPLFVPTEQPMLYSALLPNDDADDEQYPFLTASLSSDMPKYVERTVGEFFRTLQTLFDEVLDTGHCALYEPVVPSAPVAGTCAPSACDNYMEEALMEEAMPMERQSFKRVASLFRPKQKAARKECAVSYSPSRLEITPATYQVLLPDYHREIHFTAQVKALYVLFLNHPEGIRMKEIADYKDEFKLLYFRLTNRSDTDKLRGSVERLLDVCNPNALNVKKSQCNEALRWAIPEDELRSYYEIEVNRGMPHRIPLDRSLVVLPHSLIPNPSL